MAKPTIYRIVILFTLAFISAGIALCQSPALQETNAQPGINNWQSASVGFTKGKLFIVTSDRPNRRKTCHVDSFTVDKLVCSRAFGGSRTYLPKQILAVLLPGDRELKLRLLLGLNAGLGAAIWSTIALAAICPVCAAATASAALFFFGASGAILIGDDQPDRLLYLAPGYQLTK